jgi:hypothetical protein
MKKTNLFILFISALLFSSNTSGQVDRPTPADNGNINDNSIKMRSVEMERVKRQEAQAEAAKFAPVNTKIETKFPEIKEDFEGIQVAQQAIVNAYTTGKTIDYAAIENAAEEMNKKSKRLDANVFPDASTQTRKKDPDGANEKEAKPKTVRELIVELDQTIGSFVSSKIFANLKVIEPDEAMKTRAELLKIQKLSAKLAEEAKKMK